MWRGRDRSRRTGLPQGQRIRRPRRNAATAARTIAAKIEYQNKDVKTASQETIDEIEKLGGDGGLIALDKNGNLAMPFNTSGMYRGSITDKGEIEIEIYK